MRKLLTIFVTVVALAVLAICVGCGSKNEPVVQSQPTIIRQDEASAKMAQAKTAALQEFQKFRVAGTFSGGVKSLTSMELTLGRASLTHSDINVSDGEITAHLWDLAHRKPAAKKQVQQRPVVVHNNIAKQRHKK
jgi:hypothetical protein